MSHSEFSRAIKPWALTRRHLLTGAGALAVLGSRPANAVLKLDVTQGNVQPMPIALPDFVSGGPGEPDTGRNVTGVITSNLQRSGLFAPINPAAFIEKITNTDSVPRFPDWRAINAQALVTGRITRQGDGRLKVEFRLWDVFAGTQLDGKQYFTTPDNWRRIAHIISDAVYERLTGLEYLNFIGDVYGVPKKERLERMEKWLEVLELTQAVTSPIQSYSHGMKQKIVLTAALLPAPEVMVLDEPMVGLAPRASHPLKEMTREHCDQGKTLFFSTHIMEVAEKLCDRIGIINKGKLIACGSMQELKKIDQAEQSLEGIFLELTEK